MDAATMTVKNVFAKDIRYVIPLFQRPYVWTKDAHWAPLFDDVRSTTERYLRNLSLLEDDAVKAQQATAPHFLGAIVIAYISGGVSEVEARGVIDGQQRLTTLQLMLDAVQEVLVEFGEPRDAKLLAKLVLNDPDVAAHPDHRFKVWPTNIDRDAFRAAMDDGSDAGQFSGTAIADAHRFFAAEARTWVCEVDDPDDRALRCHALNTTLHGLFQLVVIDLDEDDNAQVIFETLNARGTPLLASDLVKNHILQAADDHGLDVETLYHEYWEPFDRQVWRREVRQGRLKRPRIDMLLDYWLELHKLDEVAAHDVFPALRAHLADRDPKSVLEDLHRYSVVFDRVTGAQDNSDEGTVLYRWQQLEVQTATPLLLWLFGQDPAALPVEQLHRALGALDSYLVRRTLLRLTSKNYNRLFLDLLADVVQGDVATTGDRVVDFLARQTADTGYWPNDTELVAGLLREPIYRQLKRARVRMLLEALEDDRRSPKTEAQFVARGTLTIEHVLPQKASDDEWPLPAAEEKLVEVQRRARLIHTLGNLTLATGALNPAMSNHSWDDKRRELEDHSVLLLNSDLLKDHLAFGDADITARGLKLARRAVAIWPHPASDLDAAAPEADLLSLAVDPAAEISGERDGPTPALAPFVDAGVLEAGELIVWRHRKTDMEHEGIVLEDGSIQLPNGERYLTPSGAATAGQATQRNGWKRWRVPRLGSITLATLRAQHFEVDSTGDVEDEADDQEPGPGG